MITKLVLLLGLLFPMAHGAQNQYAGIIVGAQVNGATTSIPVAFGSAGAAAYTGLSNKTHITAINTTAVAVSVSVQTATTNCSGGTDDFYLPPGMAQALDAVTINSNVCVRSLGSAISTGSVYFSVW